MVGEEHTGTDTRLPGPVVVHTRTRGERNLTGGWVDIPTTHGTVGSFGRDRVSRRDRFYRLQILVLVDGYGGSTMGTRGVRDGLGRLDRSGSVYDLTGEEPV